MNDETGNAQPPMTESALGPCSLRILRQLESDILEGKLVGGEKLPTEKELTRRFDASRSSVRKALRVLLEKGCIYSRQGSGSYVTMRDEAAPRIKTVSLMYHGHLDAVQELQNVILEKGCIMSLFSQRTQGWQPDLERCFLEQVLAQRHTALLASCTPLPPTNETLLEQLQQAGIRVVHIEPFSEQPPPQGCYMPDYQRAGYAAAVDLMLSGCENLVFCTLKVLPPFAQLLKNGFMAAGVDHRKEVLLLDQEAATAEQLKAAVAHGKTGIFSCSYQVGLILQERLTMSREVSPSNYRVLAVEMTGDVIQTDAHLDYVTFSRLEHLKNALSLVLNQTYQAPNILIPPEIIKFR